MKLLTFAMLVSLYIETAKIVYVIFIFALRQTHA